MNFHFPGEILGVRPSNDFLKIGILIRKGLPLYCLKRFREFSGASEAEVRHILWMTEADLQNRERRRRLSSRESDRLFSAVKILTDAYIFFKEGINAKKAVIDFLHRPLAPDFPLPPIRLMGTEAGRGMDSKKSIAVYL